MKDTNYKILVVDDDLEYAETCAKVLDRAGYAAMQINSPVNALNLISKDKNIRVVLTDLKMAEKGGLDLLKDIKSIDSTVEVIIMTGYGTIETAVQAIKENAADYITKPFNSDELLNAIQKVYKVWKLQNEINNLKQLVSEKLQFDGFIFKSELMSVVYNKILSAAGCNCNVFITGESGTGKELVARAIHKNSHRSSGPFIPINCSALSSQLIESELFGYKKGAFTGADRDYDGLFVAAHNGTLFLDEIVEMQTSTQAKLLRAIQEKSIRPVGSVEERDINVRFIAATNMDVSDALANKNLRQDLYHRLNVIQINIPPLRKLKDEIHELLNYFLIKKGEEYNLPIKSIDNYAKQILFDYSWPGNIRGLENLVERLYAHNTADIINVKDLPERFRDSKQNRHEMESSIPSFSDSERDLIIRALKESKGNKSRAAEVLGISRPSLYKKIDLYNID
jgi:DNA-binding NtrC family response regulator